MKDLTVVIPVHEYSETIRKFYDRAMESLRAADSNNEANVIVIGPKNVLGEIKKEDYDNKIEWVENEKSDFCSQINVAVKKIKTKWFSVLELDDVYGETWFKNVEKHIATGEEVSVYLPLTEVMDINNPANGSIGYVNEAVWASSFSERIGYLDLECLQGYMNFNTTGGVFNTDDFKSVGGLKTSMKLSFWYEFLLRTVYNKKNVYVIPKVGYYHFINRGGSLALQYNSEMKPKEAEWWIELAQKEYLFKTDRKKTYEE